MQATAQTPDARTQVAPAPAQAPQAPGAPADPAAPATPLVPTAITFLGADGKPQTLAVPRTAEEVGALKQQRREISNQLNNVSHRRSELARQLTTATEGASRTGLESRLRILDQRIVQLESDLASTGRLLAATAPELHAQTEVPSSSGDDFDEGVLAGGFFTALVVIPLVWWYSRRRWKKAGQKSTPSPAVGDERMERLERGMEAIAIEIERVSEGQRFVTKLLSEAPAGIGMSNRIAQPVPVDQGEARR